MTNFLPPPGTAYEDLETPQLVIDLPAMEHNIETLHRFFRDRPARVRSVTKGHKCPAIAQRQMTTDGAVPFGLCCAKVSEAEVMVAAGARHIRLIEQVVGKVKIERLMNLARNAQVIALVDDPRHVADLAGAAAAHGLTLDVLVEVEIGLNRTGLPPGPEAVKLVRSIEKDNRLRFAGLSSHEGSMVITDPVRREEKVRERIQRLLDCREDVERAGVEVEICGAGSSTTWNIAGAMDGITEIDPGTYVFWDHAFVESMPDHPFRLALKVLTTVISRSAPDRAVVDCGYKAMGRAADGGMPATDREGVTVNRLNSEHGVLDLEGEGRALRIGDKVAFIPRAFGPTVVGHDHYVGVRDGVVESVWPIAARASHQ